jgi:predicted  nucleic acid-binding Zn-ribbon protein
VSETLKLSSSEIRSWLENETSRTFIQVHSKADRLVDDMRKSLEGLADASKMLLDNSGKEIEKRNMKMYGRARALNKLARLFVDRLKQVKAPDKVSYASFNSYVQETQKTLFVFDVDIRNWFPRISPFFIIDRRKFQVAFEKSKIYLKELQNFQTKEYVKTKTLEDTFQLVDNLKNLETQLANLDKQKARAEAENASLDREIDETRQKMADLKSRGGLSELDQISTEIESINTEVKHNLQHLQKPFIKLQALSLHGGGSGLTQDELRKLNQYLDSPFEALATEETGYPLLRQILQKLSRLLAEGKLVLKPDKMRKAEQAVNNILNGNSLTGLHQRCVDASKRRAQLSSSSEVSETRSDLSRLQEHIERLERRSDGIDSEKSAIERAHRETLEKIANHKSQIEKNIFSFLNKHVRVA